MRSEFFADALLILVVSTIIYVILLLVNRGKAKADKSDDKQS